MIFVWPILTAVSIYYGIYIAAAIIPAVVLMKYVYKMDKIEKEPGYMLRKVILGGVLAAFASMVLETVGDGLLGIVISPEDPFFQVASAYLVVAVVEEGTKLYFMKRVTWKDYNFDYVFDGIVYSVFASLGFAALENVMYVFSYGLSVAIPRAILSIPGHMCFAVFMGSYYGHAKYKERQGDGAAAKINIWLGYIAAVILHGFYDCCLMCEDGNILVFIVFVILMYIAAHKLVVTGSKNDHHV